MHLREILASQEPGVTVASASAEALRLVLPIRNSKEPEEAVERFRDILWDRLGKGSNSEPDDDNDDE